jgi:hypothetical protein
LPRLFREWEAALRLNVAAAETVVLQRETGAPVVFGLVSWRSLVRFLASSQAYAEEEESLSSAPTEEVSSTKARGRLLRSRWVKGVAIVGLLLVGFKIGHRAMQPKYEGKTAEEWFARIQLREAGEARKKFTFKVVDRAVQALAGMEEKAIPLLSEKYVRRDSALKKKLISLLEKITRGRVLLENERERRMRVTFVIQAMGAKADALVPMLIREAKAGDEAGKIQAVICLGDIGTRPDEVLPVIIDMLGSSSSWNRALALHSVAQYAPHAVVALPLLEQRTASTNAMMRVLATRAMVDFGETNKAYKLMLREIRDTNSPVRMEAVQLLNIFGTNAISAIPLLHDMVLNTSDAKLRDTAFRQIKRIDPEARYHNP